MNLPPPPPAIVEVVSNIPFRKTKPLIKPLPVPKGHIPLRLKACPPKQWKVYCAIINPGLEPQKAPPKK